MKITKETTKYHLYALESNYDPEVVSYCKFLKQTLGWQEFSWDPTAKKWRFKDPAIVTMLKNKFPQLEVNSEIQKDVTDQSLALVAEHEREKRAQDIREAKVSTLDFSELKGAPYEYQKIGIEFLLNSGGRALLADSPGVGKSLQALGYIVKSKFKRALIVCPASVKYSWESEIETWTHLKSYVIDSKTNLQEIPFDVECLIINYDILKKFFNELMKYNFDVLIADESQLLKTPTTIRSRVVKLLSQKIPNVIMLTGTPVLSRPAEMFHILSIIDPRTWNNYYSYATRFCDGKQGYFGFEAKGATNLPELRNKISKYFLRRTKEEVLPELPPKNFINIPIDLPREERKQYDLVEENLVTYLKTYKKNKSNKDIAKTMRAEKLVKLNLLREINAMAKIPTAIELIDSAIEAGEKVLVFSSFNAPLKELEEHYEENSVMIIGETPNDERGEIRKKFQNDPKTRVFFGGMLSAGTGITLTAASNVVFLDLPWNPADIEQALNRAHRPGAKYKSLNIYKIISRNSIDSFLQKLLKRKQEIIDQLIDGKEVEEEHGMIDEYIEELSLKYKK